VLHCLMYPYTWAFLFILLYSSSAKDVQNSIAWAPTFSTSLWAA
jgi:hypothetical protein